MSSMKGGPRVKQAPQETTKREKERIRMDKKEQMTLQTLTTLTTMCLTLRAKDTETSPRPVTS
jgi:hypothetical protein